MDYVYGWKHLRCTLQPERTSSYGSMYFLKGAKCAPGHLVSREKRKVSIIKQLLPTNLWGKATFDFTWVKEYEELDKVLLNLKSNSNP
ncbi:hypothetical protein TNIN_45921 [Trichonephila inaurata madagascariensis]|uniref:Uncharacterized protein n=1 Tax=Trichonephila inaurata madagascariensis TaxID=2747483 RepID=A0A8X6WQR1_9ARAC|nr:hypothetical protein TNIN_45921 [Trichonephila inaurata madagascariensis]